MEYKKALVIQNPFSGRGRSETLGNQISRLLDQAGLECRTLRITEGTQLEREIRAALRDGCDLVVIVGGDGTLRACLDGLDVDASRVVVVGDSPNDIAAARSLGAVAVGCTYGLVAPQRVHAAAPDHVIAAFGELAGLFPSRPIP